MNAIDPDLFTKLMALPDGERFDLLEFLGATPVGETQLNAIIVDIQASIDAKRQARMAVAS